MSPLGPPSGAGLPPGDGDRVAEIIAHSGQLQAAQFPRRMGAEVGHQRLHRVHALLAGHLHVDLALAMTAVANEQLVELLVQGLALGLQPRGQFGQQERGHRGVLVANVVAGQETVRFLGAEDKILSARGDPSRRRCI